MTRRIIVALDESPASYRALQSATRLAAEMSAEIVALFIEDEDLIAVASLPGGLTVSYAAAHVTPLDPDMLMRSLRARARHLRENVARIAGDYRVSWQFQVARGRVSDEILRSAQSCEMIAIGASSMRRRTLGANVSAILSEASCSVLVFHERAPSSPRVVVVGASERGREIGVGLARINGALTFEEIALNGGERVFDQLMRMTPSHVVIGRDILAKLGVSPQALVNALDLEGLIVTAPGNP